MIGHLSMSAEANSSVKERPSSGAMNCTTYCFVTSQHGRPWCLKTVDTQLPDLGGSV